MKRKIRLSLLLAVVMLSTCMLFACGAKVKIEVDSELTMTVYETKVLEPKVSGYEGELAYSSSDPTVVGAQGATLTAYKAGTAVITVSAGDKASAEINVTVNESSVSPVISVPTQDVRIVVGTTYAFKPVVKLGENTVDGKIGAVVEDEETASYADGVITAKKIGETQITFSGKYLNTNLRPITVSVTVIDDLIVTPNKSEVSLYTYAPAGSTDYPVEDTVTVTVEEKGILVENPQIEWSIDKNDVAVVENGKITAVGAGTATVTAVYKDVTLTVAVTVTKTILPADQGITEYDLNADESDAEWLEFEFNAEDIALSEISAVNDVTDSAAKSAEFKTKSGKLLLKKNTLQDGERKIVLENDEFGVEYEVLFATKIIYDKADMIEVMALATEGYEEYPGVSPAPAAGAPKFYTGADGYFILAADIDMEGDIFRLTYLDNTAYAGFTGTFDGRGHVVSNVGGADNGNCRSGMFGLVKTGGVIKNVAFINCWGANYRTDSGTRQEGKHNVVVGCLSGGTVENVYLYAVRDEKMTQAWGTGALIGQYISGTVNNVFVAVNDLTRTVVGDGTNNPGTIIGQFVGNGGVEAVRSVTNAYGVNDLYKAVGVGTSLDDAATVARWKTYAELFDAVKAEDFGYDFSVFEKNEYWTMVDGVPVFASALELIKEETFSISGSDVVEAGKKTAIATDSKYSAMIAYELKDAPEGVTLENGVLNVSAEVSNNVSFIVAAYNVFNNTIKAEKTISVANVALLEHADFDLSEDKENYIVAMNSPVVPTKVSVESGVALTETNYKVSGTDLLISKAGVQEILGAKKYGDFSLLIETSGARSYRVELSIVTKILRDKADAQEMMRLATAGYNVLVDNSQPAGNKVVQPNYYNGADGYFVLANDIDMEGEIIRFTLRGSDTGGTPGFIGIVDGRGHKIENIGSDKYPLSDGSTGYLANNHAGIFGNLAGAVKNIAFVNVYAGADTVSQNKSGYDNDKRSAALAWSITGDGIVDNVYLSYYAGNCQAVGGAIPGADSGGNQTFRNFVVERTDLDMANSPVSATNGVVCAWWGGIKNVINTFGIFNRFEGEGWNGNVNKWTPAYATIFNSYEAMKEAGVNLSGFDGAYWDISQGYPVFKACLEQA